MLKRLLIFVFLLSFVADVADARGRLFGRRYRARRSYSAAQGSYTFSGTTPQEVAQQKVNHAAANYIYGHCGGSFGGASAEGVGWGGSPAQALANCCRFNSPIVAQATAQASNGTWFGIRLYR